jgi:hypothetical protein
MSYKHRKIVLKVVLIIESYEEIKFSSKIKLNNAIDFMAGWQNGSMVHRMVYTVRYTYEQKDINLFGNWLA